MRYRTREIFLLREDRGVLVTLYALPEPEGDREAWMDRALRMLEGLTIAAD